MYYYKYEEFTKDIETLYQLCKPYKPDIILAVARGGVTIGHFLSEKFKIRDLFTLNSIHYNETEKLDTIKVYNIPKLPKGVKVLLVDDIVDSGESLKEIMGTLQKMYPKTTFKTASIFYKKDAIFKADFSINETKEWIEFFWSNS